VRRVAWPSLLPVLCAGLLGAAAAGAVWPAAAEEGSAASQQASQEAPSETPSETVKAYGKLGAADAVPAFSAKDLEDRLAARGIEPGSPVFIRIFKEEAELELWVEIGKRFELFATYPICNWSGTLGPKLTEGDKQSPEGLYVIGSRQMRQSARWRRSMDLGFPNTFDRGLKRTGSDLLIHGGCTSEGCYAMTDPVIDEIFWLSDAALDEGQKRIQVHAFPFRMTPEKLALHRKDKWFPFWATLKEGYDYFETTRQIPPVAVCERKYLVNASFLGNASKVDPEGRCPAFQRQKIEPFQPASREQIAETRVMAPGPKMRALASADTSVPAEIGRPNTISDLLKSPPMGLGLVKSAGE
jgi:murein L,D-transpeptidase YafK